MRRIAALVALVAAAVPGAVQAQAKPSNSMHTRSAEVYLDRAKATSREPEHTDLLKKALEVLVTGMASDASNPKVWFLAGQAYNRLGDAAGADSSFRRAEALYPEYAKDIENERLALWIQKYNAGVAALQKGDEAGAIPLFEAANSIYKGRPDAAASLGSLYARAGDLAKAEASYRLALEIAQGPAAQKVAEKDRAQWQELEAAAAGRLAALLQQTGKANDAAAVYRSLLKSQPANGAAKASLAALLAKAGQKDEASRLYEELLTTGKLSDIEWFNAGVGLYSAEQYDLATKAFRKSIEVNPHSRDAWYNLGQTIYAQATAAENERKTAPEPRKAELGKRLETLNTDLLEVATKLRELDPNFRNALMMLAQAQRTLGDVATDAAAKSEWQKKVVATLQEAENLPFEVSAVELTAGEGTVGVTGRVTNLKGTAGQNVTLEFTLLGEQGETIATQTVTAALKEAGTPVAFEFDVKTDKAVMGWKYRAAS
jgi:tetratricopeptide (TPR) repeat protein